MDIIFVGMYAETSPACVSTIGKAVRDPPPLASDIFAALSSNIKIQMAQYNELSSFTQFGSDLDASTKETLEKGAKIEEVLKQQQYMPYRNADHVVILYAAMNNFLKTIDIKQIKKFEVSLLDSINRNTDILTHIREERVMTDDIKKELDKFLTEFVSNWHVINNKKKDE